MRAKHRMIRVLFGAWLVMAVFLGFFGASQPPASAAAGINHQLNFQGKVVNSDGTNVPDSTYTFVFSIYSVASGGSAIWTETDSLATVNGIFQVQLGAVTALPGSVDFNTDNIYLGMNFNSNGEMTPRVQFTAVAQAFNAEKLGGLDKTGFIQNTTTQQATSNFNISGAGVIGTTLTTPTLQSAAATALTITGNAASVWSTSAGNITLQAGSGTVSLGSTTTLSSTGALTVTGGSTLALNSTGTNAITLDSGTTGAVNIATGNASKTIQIGNAANAVTNTINIGNNATAGSVNTIILGSTIGNSTTAIQAGDGASGGISLNVTGTNNRGTIVQSTTTNSTAAFSVQRANADTLLTADTTSNRLVVGNATAAAGTDSTLLVVDSATTALLPTAINGGIIYDSTTGHFKVVENVAGTPTYKTLCNTTDLACGSSVATTLQQAYNNDTDSADATIALTSTDGNLIVQNPSSGGVTSGATLKIDQLATGAVEGLRIESAGTGNLLTIRDTTATAADVLTIADGGLITVQPATSLTAGQAHITQNLTNASATGGTVNGYSQTLTVAPTSSASITNGFKLAVTDATTLGNTNTGFNLTVTDNGASGAKLNTGLKVNLAGSNGSQSQYGVDSLVNHGIGLRGNSTDFGGTVSCGGQTGNFSIGVCGSASGNGGTGVVGVTSNSSNGTPISGAGVSGYNEATGTAAGGYYGVRGLSLQTANAAYTSMGIFSKAGGGTGATTYGGYFTLDGGSTATLGSALLASNSSIAANILQLQDNNTDVFTVADGGAVTAKNQTNSTTAFQIQNAAGNALLAADTTNGLVKLGVTAGGVANGIQFTGGTAPTFAASTGGVYYDGGTNKLKCVQNSVTSDCVSGGTVTLQSDYTNSTGATTPEILLDSTRNGLDIQDANTTIGSGQPLLAVRASATATTLGAALFSVGNTGQIVAQNTVNSTNAFQVQNAAASSALNINTLAKPNLVANSSFEGNTNGWVSKGAATISTDPAQAQFGAESLKIVTTTGITDGAAYTVPMAPTTQYTLSLYARATAGFSTFDIARQDVSGTDAAIAGCTGLTLSSASWTRFTCTFTTGGTITNSNIFVKNTGGVVRTVFIDGVQLEPGATANAYNSGISNLQVETGTNAVLINGNNSGEITPWQQNGGTGLPAVRQFTSVTANGYVYVIGGTDTAGTPQSAVYYAKLNADGSTGNWTTNTATGMTTHWLHSSVTANGYVYVIGGRDNGTITTAVYYAKLNADGSTGNWATTSGLPITNENASAVVANGYIYNISGGNGGTNSANVNSAKINPDGTLSAWTTGANTVPLTGIRLHSSVVANGYVYIIGGFSGGSLTNVYYAKLNSNGTTGAWTATTSLPVARRQSGAVVANGYVYVTAGGDNSVAYNNTYYAKLNADGTVGGWSNAASTLPGLRVNHRSVVANGYIYTIGGGSDFTDANTQSTVYYASTSRVKISGVLDLVGLNGQNLSDSGGTGGMGSSGGELIAGNTTVVGSLQVQGDSSFAQGLSVAGALNANGQGNFGQGLNVTGSIGGQNYTTGTITQSTTTVTGSGTTFTSGMVGGTLYYPDGTSTTVTGFTSTTSITVASSRTIASASSYNLQWGGLSLNGGASNIQSTTNSVNALQILNSDGVQLFNVDTATTPNLVTNSHFEFNTTGWAAKGSATISRSTSEKYQGGASLQVAATAAAGDGAKYNYTFTNGTTYSLAFDIKLSSGTWTNANLEVGRADNGSTDTPCTITPGTNLVLNGWRRYSCTFTAGAQSGSPYFYIKQLDAVSRTFYLDAVQLEVNSSSTAYQLGTTSINGVINSPVSLRNQTDSSTAFIVQNAGGNSLFTVDTQTSSINSLGLFKASAGLSVSSLSAPAAPTVAVLGANNGVTYTYTVTARNTNGGETTASATGTTAVGSTTPNNRITWTPVVGAADYNIYRTVGGTGQGLIGSTSLTTFDDVNLTGSGASPSLNSSGYVGIGNTSPGTRLDVTGALTLRAVSSATVGVSQAGQGIMLYDTTLNQFQVSENAGAYKTLCNTTDRGCNGGAVISSVQTDGGTATTTVSTAGSVYFLTQNNTDITNDVRTFNITGVSNVEGTVIYVASQAIDSGSTGTSNVIIQINGTQVSTTGVANATTIKENYTIAYISGSWRIVGLNSATAGGADTADFAEWIPYTGAKPQAGELLTIGDSSVSAKLSDQAYDRGLLGVVSTSPYQVGSKDDGHSVVIALTGRAPVKVSLENGPILPGDYLTSSSLPGVAMKATKPGTTIGKALSGYDGSGDALVTVQIQSGNADPRTQQEILQGDQKVEGSLSVVGNATIGGSLSVVGAAKLGSLTVTGATTLASLTVETATISGSLTVTGTTTLTNLRIDGSAEVVGDINLAGIGQSRNAITKQFKATKALHIGDVVIGDPANDGQVTTTNTASDTKVLGIALSETLAGQNATIAIGGSVQVRVAQAINVSNGDLLVSSTEPGAADKSTNPSTGAVLGKSLGRPDANGLVWMLVTLN